MNRKQIGRATWVIVLGCGIVAMGQIFGRPGGEVSASIAGKMCRVIECPLCVVHIKVERRGTPGRFGTGVLMDDGRVLTAAHVLKDAEPDAIHVYFGGRADRAEWDAASGRQAKIRITKNEEEDWAVIAGLDVPDWAPGVSRGKAPAVGDVLTSVGLEHTEAVRVRAARLVAIHPARKHLCIGVVAQPGDSGGPVFNADGLLVGINIAIGDTLQTSYKTYDIGGGGGAIVNRVRPMPVTFIVDLSKVKLD